MRDLSLRGAVRGKTSIRPTIPDDAASRPERHGFEYIRNGTLSLRRLNTKTGSVLGKTAARHTSEEFRRLPSLFGGRQPATQEIHPILDYLSTHKTRRVEDFLALHPNVHLRFTPTYSSWLNQVDLWFGKVQRDVIARGIFPRPPTSAASSCATSANTTRQPSRSSGSTSIDPAHPR